ncbi:PHP domain-containing protein [Aliikangiella coralliicola]|uniref:PHP domain-containing protein n=1 Tax=Aliikangiella coralliicola TaxID=2592383 RepID=A0A545UDD4_9GAMM|nr:PHP domain-containing protein [Aliikangiella coralliicola]TQV87470.1 PHP domain-containing protein [Aliikangiella coralliicola]
MRYDFHCHSHFSDGALSPEALIDYAIDKEIDVLALTDHDSTGGLESAREQIKAIGASLRLLNGIEISALTEFGEIHIVGLDIDAENEGLKRTLAIQQKNRWSRVEEYDVKLAKIGVKGILQEVRNQAVEVATRPHIARAIVNLGFAKDMDQAFKRYIGKKGRIKVSKSWVPMAEAIDLIRQAGGISVLAHPTRYPLSNRKLSLLIESFKCEGGNAMEMAYPSLNRDKSDWLKIHREKNGLLASSGSDFHYPNLRWTDLGRFPNLDPSIPHVKDELIK